MHADRDVVDEVVADFRAFLGHETCLARVIDHVVVDEAEARIVDVNGPLLRVVNRVADELELITGVGRVHRAHQILEVDRVAAAFIRANVRHCAAGIEGRVVDDAEIIGAPRSFEARVFDIHVGPRGEQHLPARSLRILGLHDHVAVEQRHLGQQRYAVDELANVVVLQRRREIDGVAGNVVDHGLFPIARKLTGVERVLLGAGDLLRVGQNHRIARLPAREIGVHVD